MHRAVLLISLIACTSEMTTPPPPTCATRSPIIGGESAAPAALAPAQARAVGAVVSGTRPFCTGTVIGDSLVLTATHCVLGNPQQWLDGAQPVAMSPVGIAFSIGNDSVHPDCTIAIAKIDVDPDAAVRTAPATANLHDFAILTLAKPIATACPGVAPIAVALDPLPDLATTTIIEGGFGGTDPNSQMSTNTQLHWATYGGGQLLDFEVVAQFVGIGSPWFGDSGSSLIAQLPGGALRVIADVSNFDGTGSARASRTDIDRAWFAPIVTGAQGCGTFGSASCVDDSVVAECTDAVLATSACPDGTTCSDGACVAAPSCP
jgi:trypsin